MNEIQDKQYLALELTKLTYQHDEGYHKRDKVMENYNYFLNELTGVLSKAEKIHELEERVEKLQGLLRLKNEEAVQNLKTSALVQILNEGKGDMEPYIYDAIMQVINQ